MQVLSKTNYFHLVCKVLLKNIFKDVKRYSIFTLETGPRCQALMAVVSKIEPILVT